MDQTHTHIHIPVFCVESCWTFKFLLSFNLLLFFFAFEEERGGEGWMSILTLITLDYRQTNNNIIAVRLYYQRWKKKTRTTTTTKYVEIIHFQEISATSKCNKKNITTTATQIPAQINKMCDFLIDFYAHRLQHKHKHKYIERVYTRACVRI